MQLIFVIIFLINLGLASSSHEKNSKTVGCGLQAEDYQPFIPSARTRIIGGDKAKAHSWPWQVSIRSKNGTWHFCGGTLLRILDNVEESDMVLTAAHCLPFENGTLGAIDDMQVFAGIHTRFTRKNDVEQRRQVIAVDYHSQYKNLTNDIAILKLDRPVHFSNIIRPVCIAEDHELPPLRKTCFVLGWGRVNPDKKAATATRYQDELKQAPAPVHPIDQCSKWWNRKHEHWSYAFLCAGPEDGSSSICNGDSGGPLICKNENGAWTQYGISSFVAGDQCAMTNFPPVFTRVSSYQRWIRRKVRLMSSLFDN